MGDHAAPPIPIPVDAALAAAARWRGLSPDAYVAAVIAEAVAADMDVIRIARESLHPDAAIDQKALEAWFDANSGQFDGG